MNFSTSRLVPGTVINPSLNSFFVYIDAWKVQAAPKPYAYYSSNGLNNAGYLANNGADCAGLGIYPPTISPPYGPAPYNDGRNGFTNSNKYQIISAGQDGVFGTGVWNASNGATGYGRDDQANFSSKILGAGQQ